MLRWLAVGVIVTLGLSPASSQGRRPLACDGEAFEDVLQGLSPLGDIMLGSGKRLGLSGIRLPDDGPAREAVVAWLRVRAGRSIRVKASTEPDRWNRLVAVLAVVDDSPPVDLARGLVEAGLALVDAGAADTLCRADLLPIEQEARKQSLGVWAEDRYKPMDATGIDRLRERIGAFVLVEGRVRSVGERQQRTYLNFGGQWAEDFTITISKKTWARMAERGLTAASLKGSRIRARGILETWQGVALTMRAPEMIERIEDPRR